MSLSDHDSHEIARLRAECAQLREENARLRALVAPLPSVGDEPGDVVLLDEQSPAADKIALFRRLFRGRDDVYAVRWESSGGRSGYSPACANEWNRALCAKPATKCADCAQRELLPLDDTVLREHLTGRRTIGIYPLLSDETCWFLALDFDKAAWQADVKAFLTTCETLGLPAYAEISRSGHGAHVWLFFDQALLAQRARALCCALLTQTLAHRHEVGLDSYDRIFPNQDTLPKGGFGNLIALPLQRIPRTASCTVFVDNELHPFADQWALLSRVRRVSDADVSRALKDATREGDVLGARMAASDEDEAPGALKRWLLPPSGRLGERLIEGSFPAATTVVQANLLFIDKGGLPQALQDRIIRLAAFENPEFYRAQAMRLPTFAKPRLISCAEDFPAHIALPRGCREAAIELLEGYGIRPLLSDERANGSRVEVAFQGELTPQQLEAARAMLAHDIGVLCAATAFGKTVVAAWLIASRQVNTLILVHRRQLMDQWRERLATFLELPSNSIGLIGGGRSKPTGVIDVAVIQSLNRKGTVNDLVADYGQVIVDECHHVGAFSFETVLKQVRARYVLGLTATPTRRDGHHPIIRMQCGPIRYRTDPKRQAAERPFAHTVVARRTRFVDPSLCAEPSASTRSAAPIQAIYSALAADEERNELIVSDIVSALENGRSPLVLTERVEHRDTLADRIERAMARFETPCVFVVAGGAGARQRTALASALAASPPDKPRVVLATGRCVGEGFDDARLDTLFLAMPIAWRGTLQQYAGRLHRLHANKQSVVIYDYIDELVPVLARMYEKRLSGYRAMGYEIRPTEAENH